MRRLVHILVFLLVAGIVMNAVLAGCRGWSSDRRLVAADTLIAHGDFDSALTQLRAVDTTALSSDDRAYHALLMVHAAYKAYADSICLDTTWIARARAAYADGGPYDRHIRTLLYSGCVAEDLGDPIQAMHWYKLTELEAKKDDRYHRGFALMNMGTLYFSNLEDSISISKFRKAIPLFDDSHRDYTQFCSQLLSQSYLKDTLQADSALFFSEQAKRFAIELGDSLAITLAMVSYAEKWYYTHDYRQAKELLVETIRTMGKWTSCECWQVTAQSYAKIGMLDSAEYYHNHSPKPSNIADTICLIKAKSWIAQLKGDKIKTQRYEILCDSIADQGRQKQTRPTLMVAEDGARMEHAQNEKRHIYFLAATGGGTLLVIFLLLMLLHRRRALKKDAKNLQTTQQLKEQAAVLNQQFVEARRQIREISETMRKQLADNATAIEDMRQKNADELKNSVELLRMHVNKVNRMISAVPKGQAKELVETFSREARLTDDELRFWLSDYSSELLNQDCRDYYADILNKCELSDKEKVLLKLVALDFSDQEIQMLLGAASEDHVRVILSRIKRKIGWDYSIRKTFRRLNN